MKSCYIFLLLLSSFVASAQLAHYSPEAMNGYTLFMGGRVHLVNNCGEQVHSWELVNASFHVKLLPNGNIIYVDQFGNAVVERDWNDNLVKTTIPDDPTIRINYEVIVLENGNYLCVGRKDISNAELNALGYFTDELGSPPHVDVIIEMDSSTGEIVWLWNIMDHVLQDRSMTLANYGIPSEHPELLNMETISTSDWRNGESFMINGMDYNPALDQIVISVRKMGEVAVIDHSTTTAEAAGHTGGRYGKGGDILYRWGNPQNYGQGTQDDQYLFYQHNPNWIEYGEHAGKMAIFNNGLFRPDFDFDDYYSTAPIIETPVQADGSYELVAGNAFAPVAPTVSYGELGSTPAFNSNYTSATKVLQNGNVLITVGGEDQVIEVTPDGSVVWDYGLLGAGLTFRVEKYALDYPAFDGRDLTPMGTIENPPSSVPCDLVSTNDAPRASELKAWINQADRMIHFNAPTESDFSVVMYNAIGQQLINVDDTELVGASSNEFALALPAEISGIILLEWRDQKTNQRATAKLFMR